jgi:DnaJ-class molecular chaperone
MFHRNHPQAKEETKEDFYTVLGLTKTATPDQIKTTFRKLSIKYHPDKNPTNREKATETFQKISAAYNVLSDSKKRKVYDDHGHQGLDMLEKGIDPNMAQNPFAAFGGFNPFNPFGPAANQQRVQRCEPKAFKLRLSEKELFYGGYYKLNVSYKSGCDSCEGTGSSLKKLEPCTVCNGRGFRVLRGGMMGHAVQMMQKTCDACMGKGQTADKKNLCQTCKGPGYTNKNKSVDFVVYPGMDWNMQIPLRGMGDELRDHIPGDLVIVLLPPKSESGQDTPTGSETDSEDNQDEDSWLLVKPGPSFPPDASATDVQKDATLESAGGSALDINALKSSALDINALKSSALDINALKSSALDTSIFSNKRRNGADLIYTVSIPLVNALTGFKYVFTHPATKESVYIEHNEVITPGLVYYVPGKGMPELDREAVGHQKPLDQLKLNYGRLIFEFEIVFPTKIAKKTAEVLHALFGPGLALPASLNTPSNSVTPVKLLPLQQANNEDDGASGQHPFMNGGAHFVNAPQCAQQ